jgi:hypothetical protein
METVSPASLGYRFPFHEAVSDTGLPLYGRSSQSLISTQLRFRRERLLRLARKCYMQIIAHCYPVFAFFSGPIRIVGPLILAVTTTRLTEPEAASLGGGSTSSNGLNCRPQGLTIGLGAFLKPGKTRKDTLNKNARQSQNKRPSFLRRVVSRLEIRFRSKT